MEEVLADMLSIVVEKLAITVEKSMIAATRWSIAWRTGRYMLWDHDAVSVPVWCVIIAVFLVSGELR